MAIVLRFPHERSQARAAIAEYEDWWRRLDAVERTPEALAEAVREQVQAGCHERAIEVLRAILSPWVHTLDRPRLRQAFALLARLSLPPSVRATVVVHAMRVRHRVLGAEWWLRR